MKMPRREADQWELDFKVLKPTMIPTHHGWMAGFKCDEQGGVVLMPVIAWYLRHADSGNPDPVDKDEYVCVYSVIPPTLSGDDLRRPHFSIFYPKILEQVPHGYQDGCPVWFKPEWEWDGKKLIIPDSSDRISVPL